MPQGDPAGYLPNVKQLRAQAYKTRKRQKIQPKSAAPKASELRLGLPGNRYAGADGPRKVPGPVGAPKPGADAKKKLIEAQLRARRTA